MAERKITLHGISCESCGALITRIAAKRSVKVAAFDIASGEFSFEADDTAKIDGLLSELDSLGYSPERRRAGHSKRAWAFLSDMVSGEKYPAEYGMALVSFFAVIASAGLQFAAVALLGLRPQFAKIFPYAMLMDVSVAAIAFTIWHFKSIRKQVSCMTGMMVGMTVGMMAGFMVGYFLGATNGMFVASVVGVLAGAILGVWAGKCCGVMGAMEGMMGGLMAGTMGAMLSVMLIADNLLAFSLFFLAVCLSILAAHCYMLTKEFGAAEEGNNRPVAVVVAIALSSLALVLLMLIGPKGAITIA